MPRLQVPPIAGDGRKGVQNTGVLGFAVEKSAMMPEWQMRAHKLSIYRNVCESSCPLAPLDFGRGFRRLQTQFHFMNK
mgnify:CR=1 FL=1